DIWDFLFRAHARNAELLRARAAAGGEVRGHWSDTLIVVGAILVLLAALALPIVVTIWILRRLLNKRRSRRRTDRRAAAGSGCGAASARPGDQAGSGCRWATACRR